jgi:membrane associated rhomboid family serine protease
VSDDYCYRHPGRESYVLCQRCARTVCGDCQITQPVGVVCPECHTAAVKTQKTKRGFRFSGGGERQSATFVLLAVIVVVYVGQLLTGGWLTQLFLYWPPLTPVQPWRMITAIFVHSQTSFFHILFNGYSLYILGTLVERLIGSGRFLSLFFLSGFGGSVAVLLLAPASAVVGASGAIFGLFGALFVIQRSFGGANIQLLIVLALNLVLGFVVPGISWQAHIGGLLVGSLVAWIFVRTRGPGQGSRQNRYLALVGLGLAGITVARVLI